MALFEARGLSKSFGGLRAVDNVSFDVREGAIKALIGPNGAGKTTLFNLVSGYLPLDSGSVKLAGRALHGSKTFEIAGAGIARTYQHIRLFHKMTALENVMVGRHRLSRAGFFAGMLRLPYTRAEERRIREKSMDALEFAGVAGHADTDATSLSYGQQRLVEIARALALEPRLLLLDEPAAGLNMHETSETAKLITRIRGLGVTVLVVEHDMSLVMNISDEVMVLSYGSKIAEDTPLGIQKNEEVVRVYLGEEDGDA
jgi:branched-chain amino acid transport system ATP-binding protein